MSFEVITEKLLNSIKSELKKDEHMNTINNCIHCNFSVCYFMFKFKNLLFLKFDLNI